MKKPPEAQTQGLSCGLRVNGHLKKGGQGGGGGFPGSPVVESLSANVGS